MTKKPSTPTSGRVSSTDDTHTPLPSKPRTATPPLSTAATTNGTSTPIRNRSIRSSTISARAAAHRTTSSFSLSSQAEAEARAETVALIEDLKDRLQRADLASEQYRKQSEVLQSRLDETVKERSRLEERAHEHEEQIESLRNEKREAARQTREMEAIYEAERSSMMKEKEEMSNREEEMQTIINRLKENLNQRNAEDECRSSRQLNSSPSVDSNFAPPSSVQRSDSRNNSKLLLQKDKLIESLRLELAEAQIKLVESENRGGGRLQEVEQLLMETKMANLRLMEDNESYQLLLQEKTLQGDFGKGDFNYMGVSANQDALNALEGRNSTGSALAAAGTSLADELGSVADESEMGEDVVTRRLGLEAELRSVKDQNKALTLYINKIIERLLQHQEFEHILDTSSDAKPSANVHKALPAPPSFDATSMGAAAVGGTALGGAALGGAALGGAGSGGLLMQRAKSMASGTATVRPKLRPVTIMPAQNLAHTNPDTAPSIPIGLARGPTARRGRPMSDQMSGAASFVNAMYKGPDGPLSPTFSNPRSSSIFSARMSQHGMHSAGNFPGMRSETSSVSGDSISAGEGMASSPTRLNSARASIAGSEKGTTLAGNKPRPLRLVQENNPDKHDKRASWMGWASAAFTKKDEHAAAEAIRE